MKRKALFILLATLIFAFIFAISSSAVTGSTSDEFGEVTEIENMTSKMLDRDAKVVLKNADGTYSTYYTYYIYPTKAWNNAMKSPNFDALNSIVGESYNNSSIIRIELLSDCTAFELPAECNTYLKELIYPDDISFSTMPRTYFKALEKVYISSNFTKISGNTLRDTTALKEVIFSENFSLTSLPSGMFINCPNLEEISIPNSVVSLGGSMFSQCTSLKKIYFGENTKSIGTSNLIDISDNAFMIYASSNLDPIKTNTFTYGSHTPVNVTLFYVGTKEDVQAFVSASNHNAVKNATLVEYDATKSDDYYVNSEQSAWTIVYGYSKCQAFYGGHDISDKLTLHFTDYTSVMKEMSGCTRNCGLNDVVNEFAPIFSGYKISVKEEGYALCVTYSINNESVSVYNKYNEGATLSYGVVASKGLADGESLLSINNGSVIKDKENAILIDFNTEYSGFDFVLRGFDESHETVKLIVNAYVTDGKNIYYISSKTNDKPIEITMAEVKSLS